MDRAMVTVLSEERWDLTEIFADDFAFHEALLAFRGALPELLMHRGRLAESSGHLAAALGAASTAERQLRRLHGYTSLRSDLDLRIAERQADRQTTELAATEYARHISWLRPEIVAIPDGVVEGWLSTDPALGEHRQFLRDLLRQKQHVLTPAEENIVAESRLLFGAPRSIHGLLTQTELPRPEVTLHDGVSTVLTPVNFQRLRSTAHREDRQAIFSRYFESYASFRGTLGEALQAALKSHLFLARVRRYSGCLDAALDADHLSPAVYRNLIAQVRRHLPVIHRYFRLRAHSLGLNQLEYVDLHCPLSAVTPQSFTPHQVREILESSLAPLGEGYVEALREAFRSRWIDWHPTPGKRSGAYSAGSLGGAHPFVLLNFVGDAESVLIAAHEMGHALHSHLSNNTQPFPMAEYPIFVAEVASTFNELLVLEHLLQEAASPQARLALLANHLDGIRATLFRQTMFAEFELELHERVERGEVLTGERIDEIYLRLLRDYHGHDQGVVHVADRFAIEWAAVPHFYYNFYVFKYATGIIAATALARGVIDRSPGAREAFLEFLGAGGSDYPLALLRRAGVDLESERPYHESFASVEHQIDRLEACLTAVNEA